jgi:hypothetical protein
MSLSSKRTKVKAKGNVRELKLVHSISRRGAEHIKTEEVKTPRQETPSTSQRSCSASPVKRPKLQASESGPIPFILDGPDMYKKQHNLVCLLPS